MIRQVRKEDRLLKAASHMLVSVLLGERLGIGYRELVFRRGKYGKPYLDYEYAPSFNLSHSGKLVVCALADLEVGVDVERSDPLDAAVIRTLLGETSPAAIGGLAEPEELQSFYERWTMLESWLKAEGTGLSGDCMLASFNPRCEGQLFRAEASDCDSKPWIIERLSLGLPISEPYVLSVCRRPEERPASEINMLDASSLAQRFCRLI
ncbi:hypothetical protein GCM10010969_32060 [Saccharibacillus kuerlensis]|uniref:4'-phosphopantetheinyl transferase n=1 Tax=Saccharibacillus kuerlensis TaxID=459527 RepID=A0ABQ2L973_9BACL|nr:4'-phosphopantetheinyl transferase superfamily protein [Saccharibacillus kuerlensis]GGO05545.1 hypothetical protein GCM10010969_32060 [Saccharibacillus kuerlensis]